jgi:heme/copper-type cytochrome/quinol oxidase subunit 3
LYADADAEFWFCQNKKNHEKRKTMKKEKPWKKKNHEKRKTTKKKPTKWWFLRGEIFFFLLKNHYFHRLVKITIFIDSWKYKKKQKNWNTFTTQIL